MFSVEEDLASEEALITELANFVQEKETEEFDFERLVGSEKSYWRGRLSTIDLRVLTC